MYAAGESARNQKKPPLKLQKCIIIVREEKVFVGLSRTLRAAMTTPFSHDFQADDLPL